MRKPDYLQEKRTRPIGFQHVSPQAIGQDSLLAELLALQVAVVNEDVIREYLGCYPDVPIIVHQTATEIRQRLPDVRLALELVSDMEDDSTKTLLLYLQTPDADARLFEVVRGCNAKLAERMARS